MVPFVIFVLAQIRVRSFEDLNCATFGLLFSLINAAVFQVCASSPFPSFSFVLRTHQIIAVIKWLIVRHFLPTLLARN